MTIACESQEGFTVARERVVPFPEGVMMTHEILVDAHSGEVRGSLSKLLLLEAHDTCSYRC